MDRLHSIRQAFNPAGSSQQQADAPQVDTAEHVYISSLALLKMLKHGAHPGPTLPSCPLAQEPSDRCTFSAYVCIAGRAGVPMEVMGLMLGEFVDDYTVKVVDVFAMPQSGTGVSVEAVDPVFQTKMLDMLKQTGRCDALLPRQLSNCGWHKKRWTGLDDSTTSLARKRPLGPGRNSGLRWPLLPHAAAPTGAPRLPGCAGLRWWWAGTTATPASAVGCRA